MAQAQAVLRVFWPEHLTKYLSSSSVSHTLYGWHLPDPGVASISGATTATYIIAGALPVARAVQDIDQVLLRINDQAGRRGLPYPVVLLASWSPTAAAAAAARAAQLKLQECRNSLPADVLLHLSGSECCSASLNSSSSRAVQFFVPALVAHPVLATSQSNQVILYPMPHPGRSHFPAAAEGGGSRSRSGSSNRRMPASCSWIWMGEWLGPTPLEQALQLMNHACWVQQLAQSCAVQEHGSSSIPGSIDSAAAARRWLAAKLAGPSDMQERSGWLTATPGAMQVARKLRGLLACRPAEAQLQHDAQLHNRDKLACERAISSELLQHLLGLLLALALLRWQEEIYHGSLRLGTWALHSFYQPNIAWLMTAKPGGVKLHAELTFLYGTGSSSLLAAAEQLYHAAWQPAFIALLHMTAAIAALLGLCPCAALIGDVLLLLAWPAELLYAFLAKVYSLQLHYIGATWRLMRGDAGRKLWRRRVAVAPPQPSPNSLWGNNDKGRSDEVTVEHLIVGVLLFTPLLALLPTTIAWYMLAAVAHCAIATARLLFVKLGQALQYNPLQLWACRLWAPGLFPRAVLIHALQKQEQQVAAGGDAAQGQQSKDGQSRTSCMMIRTRQYRIAAQPEALLDLRVAQGTLSRDWAKLLEVFRNLARGNLFM